MKNILVGQKINKSFGNGEEQVKVLRDVSLEIHEGEFISVMGPSGSGKSTLLYAVSGMDTIDNGSITFLEQELISCKEEELADIRRQKMGFVFQQPTFLKNLTLLDNIVLPAMRDNPRQAKKLANKATALMEKTAIGELAQRMTSQVSGGQLQRAGICRALMNDPQILFGDEPTGALNSKAAQEIMDHFLMVNGEGITIMLVTHDARVAAQSERILFMKDGRITDELLLGKYAGEEIEQRVEKVTEKMLAVEM